MSYQETNFTNVGDSWMPALASTMEDLKSKLKTCLGKRTVLRVQTLVKKYLVSPRKSVETTMSVVYPKMPLRGPASLAAFST